MSSILWIGLFIGSLFTFAADADVVIPSERVKTHLNVRDLDTNAVIDTLAKGESATYIDTIPYYYVIELTDGRRAKVAKSYSRHIEGSTSSTLKIATFNIQIFGKTKASKPVVMAELADIIRQYDIVAIQEIKDKDENVPTQFLNIINTGGSTYAFLLSPRGGREPDDQGSQEQYAFYYNTATVKALDTGMLFDDSANDLFQREPFIARFGSVRGGLTFVLITIHTKPEVAVEEIKSLATVIQAAQSQYTGEDDFVALGDYNAGCNYASPADLVGDPIKTQYQWLIPDSADTNVSTNSACAYDRIVISEGMDDDYTGAWGIGAVSGNTVSDHFPVWAEFSVGFHN